MKNNITFIQGRLSLQNFTTRNTFYIWAQKCGNTHDLLFKNHFTNCLNRIQTIWIFNISVHMSKGSDCLCFRLFQYLYSKHLRKMESLSLSLSLNQRMLCSLFTIQHENVSCKGQWQIYLLSFTIYLNFLSMGWIFLLLRNPWHVLF